MQQISVLCRHQRGISLLAGMMLLGVLAIMVVAAVTVSILQEKMAGNQRDQATAFQRAEQTLVASVDVMANPPFDPFNESAFSNPCTAPVSGLCNGDMNNAAWTNYSDSDWARFGLAGSDESRFVVIYSGAGLSLDLGNPSRDRVFRVISRSPGLKSGTFVYLENTFLMRPNNY
jgi:Tfp pilus assembly protein PilX